MLGCQSLALGGPDLKMRYCVPSGNFGDIFAGHVAREMGLPIEQLIVATNVNDILARTVATGRYEVAGVVPTTSPSMDIQISSNFERLLFDVYDRNAAEVNRLMSGLKQSGAFTVDGARLEKLNGLCAAGKATEKEVGETMRSTLDNTGELLDPHTAVGVHVASHFEAESPSPLITLATAHPAKFPDAVREMTGRDAPLPAHVGDLFEREERLDILPNDLAEVQAFIAEHTSVKAGEAA